MLGASARGWAQCVVPSIRVFGEVHSTAEKRQIIVRVHANRGERVSDAEATQKHDRFYVVVPFDTFASVHWFGAHNCTCRPTSIEVLLVAGGTPTKTVKLSITQDFTWDEKRGEWRNVRPVMLDDASAPASHSG